MIDLIQVQEDLHGLLMSAAPLATVNIVPERRLMLAGELALDTLCQTVRNGCQGNGVLIEMPQVAVESSGVSGPPQVVILSFVCCQSGDAALLGAAAPGGPAGGGLYAEQIEQYLVDALHLQNIQGLGTLTVSGRFSRPARDYPRLRARRTLVQCTPRQTAQTPRTAAVAAAFAGGAASLACATPGAVIYYTLDGSFPASALAVEPVSGGPVNPAARCYTAPFAAPAGALLRAAAYAPGFNVGPVAALLVP